MSSLHPFAALAVFLSVPLFAVAGCNTATVDPVYDPFGAVNNPGGRPLGDACAFDDQCVTTRCSGDLVTGSCGECVTIKALGQTCTGLHEGCSTSASCKDGICQSLRKVEGETCARGPKGDDLGECDVEFYCAPVTNSIDSGRCTRRISIGDSCGEGYSLCVPGAICKDKRCEIPAPGTCLYGIGYGCGDVYTYYCGDDLLCHPGTLMQNEACGIVDGNFVKNECGLGLVCGNLEFPNGGGGPGTTSTCLPLPAKGEPCIRYQCAEGLFCHEPADGLTDPTCDTPRNEGEACSNEYYLTIACAAGLECRANTCQVACR